ncbi:hypothetical protein Sjap_020587 [Stephania japonica]|uniref:Uncharacterized protein n=1 Tax=Stephania japonica TaxID=461633 RepID=A0AAP0HVP9_9MAGN
MVAARRGVKEPTSRPSSKPKALKPPPKSVKRKGRKEAELVAVVVSQTEPDAEEQAVERPTLSSEGLPPVIHEHDDPSAPTQTSESDDAINYEFRLVLPAEKEHRLEGPVEEGQEGVTTGICSCDNRSTRYKGWRGHSSLGTQC